MTVCSKCDQEVVKKGWFWVLTTEENSSRATFCPTTNSTLHEVDEDEEEK